MEPARNALAALNETRAGGIRDRREPGYLDTLTGRTLYRFEYQSGLLSTIIDAEGNRALIHRDATQRPLAIEAPDGQRTELQKEATTMISCLARETATLSRRSPPRCPNGPKRAGT